MLTGHLMKRLADTLSTVFTGKVHYYVRGGATDEINKQSRLKRVFKKEEKGLKGS